MHSATYTSDSDYTSIYLTDSGFYWRPANESYDKVDIFSTKNERNFAAALISHCNPSNGRTEYIQELKRFIDVKVYGKCGLSCSKTESCNEMIGKHYKFYLAFENTVCRDYITEKLFKMLRYDIIPVVLGAGDGTNRVGYHVIVFYTIRLIYNQNMIV
jgi:hypothetical protein